MKFVKFLAISTALAAVLGQPNESGSGSGSGSGSVDQVGPAPIDAGNSASPGTAPAEKIADESSEEPETPSPKLSDEQVSKMSHKTTQNLIKRQQLARDMISGQRYDPLPGDSPTDDDGENPQRRIELENEAAPSPDEIAAGATPGRRRLSAADCTEERFWNQAPGIGLGIIQQVTAANVAACRTACKANSNCKYFELNGTTCIMTNRDASQLSFTNAAGWHSGPRDCTPPAPIEKCDGKTNGGGHFLCDMWAQSGECSNNPGYMRVQCAQSCCVFGCSDKADLETRPEVKAKCVGWAKAGECTKNPNYMLNKCAKSCCEEQSSDNCAALRTNTGGNKDCDYWASIGECARNPNYMRNQCAKSCCFKETQNIGAARDASVYVPEFRFDGSAECYPDFVAKQNDFHCQGHNANTVHPIYWRKVQCGSDTVYQYWHWYGKQNQCIIGGGGEHGSDWEHVNVRVSSNGQINKVVYYQHAGFYSRRSYETSRGTHPVAYVGKVAHGSYHAYCNGKCGWTEFWTKGCLGSVNYCQGGCGYWDDFRNPGFRLTNPYLIPLEAGKTLNDMPRRGDDACEMGCDGAGARDLQTAGCWQNQN